MKKIILLIIALLFVLPLSAQFTAKMFFSSLGKEHVFTVYSSDSNYRYEFNEEGQAGVIIAKNGLMKDEGEEMVNGVKCTRSTLWNKENPTQKMYTVWLSDKYKFPVKLINHIDGSSGDSLMELKDIEPWTPNAHSFEIPSGYQVMDMPR